MHLDAEMFRQEPDEGAGANGAALADSAEGVEAVPKAASPEDQRRNLDVFDFAPDGDDLTRLAALGGGKRLINPAWAPEWDPE